MKKMDIDDLFRFEEYNGGYALKRYRLLDDPSVEELDIPSEYKGKPIISIGQFAFSNAKYLCSVKVSEGIGEIGESAFFDCKKLKTIILPDSLTVIENNAFFECTELEDLSFPSGLKVIGDNAFNQCKLKSVVLPDDLEELGKFAFNFCFGLRSVILPKALKIVKNRTFYFCENLENIVFPDGLKEIEGSAFYKCGFRTLTFPSGLKKIGFLAFAHCEKLEKIDFGESSPVMDPKTFECCPKLSAENILQRLACSVDITKPFSKKYISDRQLFWDEALREDVFALALKYDSFALFDKGKILKEIVKRDLNRLLPLAENAGWIITEKCMEKLLRISLNNSFIETTAWLLDYKNRKISFGKA